MTRGARRSLAWFSAACALALPHPAAGQERITLAEALARGLQHSARLAELDARQAGAAAAEAGRAAARLPVVTALAGYTRTNHVEEFAIAAPGQPPRVIYPDVPDNFRTRLDLQWPIYTAGRVGALERAARAERQALGADLDAARADLRLEITRAFWALVTARDSEAVLARSVANLDSHVRDLRVRLEQGLIPPNEVLTAEAQRSRHRGHLIEAGSTRRTAEAELRRLIGGDGPLVPAAEPHPPIDSPGDAVVPRPERRALEERLTASKLREDAASAQRRPQVSLAGGYDYARPNPRIFPRQDRWDAAWDVSVNLSWTLWDGGRREAERAEAAAASRAVQARITEFDRAAAFEIEARRAELDAASAAIAAAEDGIRAAEEARRVVAERYQAGVATSTEVLDAELVLLQAQLDRTRSLAAARLGEARLARAAGVR